MQQSTSFSCKKNINFLGGSTDLLPMGGNTLLILTKQHNQPDFNPDGLGATCQVRSMLITQLAGVVAGLSVMFDISQGSVATHMRCGGIFDNSVTTNFLLIPTVKIFPKSVNIW